MGVVEGLLLWLLIASRDASILAIIIAIPFLTFFFFRPEWAILAIIALTASFVFHFSLPTISVGFADLFLSDVILLYVLALVPLKLVLQPSYQFRRTPLSGLVLAFFAAGLIGGITAVRNGAEFGQTMGYLRYLSYYLIFFPVANLVRDRRTLLTLLGGLASITVLIVSGQVLESLKSPLSAYLGGYRGSYGIYSGVVRVFPPGAYLVFVALICALSITLVSGTRRVASLLLLSITLAVGVAITFSRVLWAMVIFSLLLVLAFVSTRRRILFIAGAALSVALVLVLAAGGGPTKGFSSALSERIGTVFKGDVMQSGSAQWRVTEDEFALRAIAKSPVIGHGLGYQYRPSVFGRDDELNSFIHNSYLWILKDMGIVGLIPFAALVGVFLARGFAKWRKLQRGEYRALILGTTVSMLGLLLFAIQGSTFIGNWGVSVIGLLFGLNEAIYALDDDSVHQSSATAEPGKVAEAPQMR